MTNQAMHSRHPIESARTIELRKEREHKEYLRKNPRLTHEFTACRSTGISQSKQEGDVDGTTWRSRNNAKVKVTTHRQVEEPTRHFVG